MAIPGFPWLTEGLQVLLIALAFIIVILVLIRYLSFYARYRKIRQENMELASHLKKKLKTAKLRPLEEALDEQDDEMFAKGSVVKAKAPVIPASYEARLGKTRKKATRKKKRAVGRKARKAKKSRQSTSTPLPQPA